jgi:DNA repair ATPase RecN|tara:strand:- start:2244 stop:2501 length:258 start_codon:yes stop_codon:yes gene_type:complete
MDDLAKVVLDMIKISNHEVVIELQRAFEKDPDHSIAVFNSWLDELQEMYDKAERVEDLENSLYNIDNLVDEAENSISEIRGYTNV